MTGGVYRLPVGGLIDRSQPLQFQFNGKRYCGYQGDTLASALLANGVHLVGRSFKYHRPRGVMSAGAEEANAYVQLCLCEDEPNVNAAVQPLYDGLVAKSINCWPSVETDVGAVNDLMHDFLPAGFYYKTFKRPGNAWNFYGWFVRRAAGMGVAPKSVDQGRYEKHFHHTDVLIVGAGPSGLAAALEASKCGARVTLIDDQNQPGGSLLNRPGVVEQQEGREWTARVLAELQSHANFRYKSNTTAVAYYDHNMIYAVEEGRRNFSPRERLWRIRAQQVIIAAGAIERPQVFVDNDRPGIMLASAAATYAHRYAVKPGRRAVILTNNDSAYESAILLSEAGVDIAAILDTRSVLNEEIFSLQRQGKFRIHIGQRIKNVFGVNQIRGVTARSLDGFESKFECDLLCVSGGWNPTVHLHAQSGGKPRYCAEIASFKPGDSVQNETSCGAAAGLFGLEAALTSGRAVGAEVARSLGFTTEHRMNASDIRGLTFGVEPIWEHPIRKPGQRAFVDTQNDVASSDIRLAVREGYSSVELVKRYTTGGMGIDQGKTGNVNLIGILADLEKRSPGEIGTTTYRPAYTPFSFASLAGIEQGEIIFPVRKTPITPLIEKSGAIMDEAGALFRRPFCFPNEGETYDDAVKREAMATRTAVGMYDGTPLGKIEANGPDVVEFLNRVYTNKWDSLKIGQGRFGIMLREDGRMFDDGVTFRLGERRYLISTGSGVAYAVHRHLERLLQCEWPDLKVYLTPVTEQWANICICGPRTREVIAALGSDIDFSNTAFPFMAIREGVFAGFDARVMRVSYTGELSFEINVRARDGAALWEKIYEAGKPYGMTLVGSETSLLLRLEKGFMAAWAEGEGYANIYDMGMGWVVNKKKEDFIGKRSLDRDLTIGGPRPDIVGLVPSDPNYVPPEGAPLVTIEGAIESDSMIGHVTAAGYSPNLGHSIALAQLLGGKDRSGETVNISGLDGVYTARITAPCFIDPSGERMKM